MEDGSSPVFENIEERYTHLDRMEELEENFEAELDSLASYEGDSLDSQLIIESTEEMNRLVESLA